MCGGFLQGKGPQGTHILLEEPSGLQVDDGLELLDGGGRSGGLGDVL